MTAAVKVRAKRSAMFEAEAKRQLNLIPRIEKIHVEYQGQPENATLVLNKVSCDWSWNIELRPTF